MARCSRIRAGTKRIDTFAVNQSTASKPTETANWPQFLCVIGVVLWIMPTCSGRARRVTTMVSEFGIVGNHSGI